MFIEFQMACLKCGSIFSLCDSISPSIIFLSSFSPFINKSYYVTLLIHLSSSIYFINSIYVKALLLVRDSRLSSTPLILFLLVLLHLHLSINSYYCSLYQLIGSLLWFLFPSLKVPQMPPSIYFSFSIHSPFFSSLPCTPTLCFGIFITCLFIIP